jgi:hypothetical protein
VLVALARERGLEIVSMQSIAARGATVSGGVPAIDAR